MMRVGTMPACASRLARLGLALARTSGRAFAAATGVALRLFETIGDAALAEVIGRHLDQNLVPHQHADAVLAHLARSVGDNLMPVLELHTEGRVGKQFRDGTRKLEQFFFGHSGPVSEGFQPLCRAGGSMHLGSRKSSVRRPKP